jgi:hypothetical protein
VVPLEYGRSARSPDVAHSRGLRGGERRFGARGHRDEHVRLRVGELSGELARARHRIDAGDDAAGTHHPEGEARPLRHVARPDRSDEPGARASRTQTGRDLLDARGQQLVGHGQTGGRIDQRGTLTRLDRRLQNPLVQHAIASACLTGVK